MNTILPRPLLGLFLLLAACGESESTVPRTPPSPIFLFQSGFEDGVTVNEHGQIKCSGDIVGSDGSEYGHWVDDLESSPVEDMAFCYGGKADYPEQRGIASKSDPDAPNNTVLYTWVEMPAENYKNRDTDKVPCSCSNGVDNAGKKCEDVPLDANGNPLDGYDNNGTRKARVQMAINAEEGSPFPNVTYSVRIRLGDAFDRINTDYPQKLEWMTIGEFWNQSPPTDEKQQFGDRARVTLNLVKESVSDVLHFGLKMDIQPSGGNTWQEIWPEESNNPLLSSSPVPIQEWFTLQVSLVAGDAMTGRATVDIVRENGDKEQIFDVAGATLYPDNPVKGFTALNPIKLYASGNLSCWLHSLGLRMDAHWDDFSFAIHPTDWTGNE